MATFNVFVVGPVDDAPRALPELAEAMSRRYGLPATELVTRLKRGRFRVKSNLDEATAERYRIDLQSIGARVIIEDADVSPTATPIAGLPVLRPSALSLPPINQPGTAVEEPRTFTILGPQHPREPARATTPPMGSRQHPPSRPAAPPSALSAAGPRPTTTPPPRPSASDVSSGLSAAYGQASPQADLGALGQSNFSLSSLDGEEAPAASNQFDTEPEKPIVKITAKPKSSEPPRKRPSTSKAMDLFAPPDAGDENLSVDLAIDEVEERARKKVSMPPPMTVPLVASQSMPMARKREGGTSSLSSGFSREHFVLGVVIALVVGFIPAHFVASMREKTAFAAIDKQVAAAYASADSFETYQALDSAREKFLDDKQSKRSMIGLTSMLLWAVISSGVAFAFFRLRKN